MAFSLDSPVCEVDLPSNLHELTDEKCRFCNGPLTRGDIEYLENCCYSCFDKMEMENTTGCIDEGCPHYGSFHSHK